MAERKEHIPFIDYIENTSGPETSKEEEKTKRLVEEMKQFEISVIVARAPK